MRKKRAGSARRGKAASKRKPKGQAEGRRCACRPALEQRHLDLIALFLVAFGVYLVFVLFFGWEGGKVGYGRRNRRSPTCSGEVGARDLHRACCSSSAAMLLTGTSVSDLARGIGRGAAGGLPRPLRRRRRGRPHGRQDPRRLARAPRGPRPRRRPLAGADRRDEQLSASDDEDFEPTVALGRGGRLRRPDLRREAETRDEDEPSPPRTASEEPLRRGRAAELRLRRTRSRWSTPATAPTPA